MAGQDSFSHQFQSLTRHGSVLLGRQNPSERGFGVSAPSDCQPGTRFTVQNSEDLNNQAAGFFLIKTSSACLSSAVRFWIASKDFLCQ